MGSWCFPVVLAGGEVAGLRLARTASERRGSADRHADVRGSGPQVGCAQAVAPDLMRRAVLGVAVRSRGSCPGSAVLRRVLELAGAVTPISDRPRVGGMRAQACSSAHKNPASSRATATTATPVMCLRCSSCRKAAAQAQLGRPGAGQGVGRDVLLTLAQGAADEGPVMIRPGRFHQLEAQVLAGWCGCCGRARRSLRRNARWAPAR